MMNLFRKFKERFWVDPDNKDAILLDVKAPELYKHFT